MHGIINGRRDEIRDDRVKKNHKIPRKQYMSARVYACVFGGEGNPVTICALAGELPGKDTNGSGPFPDEIFHRTVDHRGD